MTFGVSIPLRGLGVSAPKVEGHLCPLRRAGFSPSEGTKGISTVEVTTGTGTITGVSIPLRGLGAFPRWRWSAWREWDSGGGAACLRDGGFCAMMAVARA